MKSKAIKIELNKGEKLRKYLIKNYIIRTNLEIIKDEKFLYLPINKISKELKNFKIVEKNFKENKKKINSFKDFLDLPSELKKEIPTSFDVIGDIILIKIPKNIQEYKDIIGDALLKTNKNIKTVCSVKPVSGELRIRDIKIIAGEKQTLTVHKEYGLKFLVDIKKTYFSARLANERMRVAKLVKPEEIIVDMFTGVAPFSIMIAKVSNPKIIYAIDKNKDSINFAKKNLVLNNILDKVELINEDSKNIKNLFRNNIKADRIIMNLPFSAYLFFENAFEIAAEKCIIHYYAITKEEEIPYRIEFIRKKAEEKGYKIIKADVNKIKTYAPRQFYIGIDITAKKINADVA